MHAGVRVCVPRHASRPWARGILPEAWFPGFRASPGFLVVPASLGSPRPFRGCVPLSSSRIAPVRVPGISAVSVLLYPRRGRMAPVVGGGRRAPSIRLAWPHPPGCGPYPRVKSAMQLAVAASARVRWECGCLESLSSRRGRIRRVRCRPRAGGGSFESRESLHMQLLYMVSIIVGGTNECRGTRHTGGAAEETRKPWTRGFSAWRFTG